MEKNEIIQTKINRKDGGKGMEQIKKEEKNDGNYKRKKRERIRL